MIRILFVDDEPRLTAGLKRMLHPMRSEWHMEFVSSGPEALAELAKSEYDMIISDMRMPVMDGAELLAAVKEQYPRMARIILSGHTEEEAALRALPVAHQFLAKPCDPDSLKDTIRRTFHVQNVVQCEKLRAVIGSLDTLPSVPRLFTALTAMLADPTSSINSVADLLEQDPAMSGKILHLVNTAFFGQPQHTADIAKAVSLMGTTMIRNLALGAEVFEAFPMKASVPGFSVDEEQRHASAVAHLARHIAPSGIRENAFTGGLLHDAGKLILASRLPEQFRASIRHAEENGVSDVEAECEVIGASHAEAGAYLLGLWGLPTEVSEAVLLHHDVEVAAGRSLDITKSVCIANIVVNEMRGRETSAAEKYEILGVAGDVPDWRACLSEPVQGSVP